MQEAFLGYLYSMNFSGQEATLDEIDSWVKSTKMDRGIFWKQYEGTIKADLIHFVQDEATVRLTPKGTLHAEKSGLVPADNVSKNREIRKKLVQTMAFHLTQKSASIYVSDLAREAKITPEECIGNIYLLVEMGYARWQVRSELVVITTRVCGKSSAQAAA